MAEQGETTVQRLRKRAAEQGIHESAAQVPYAQAVLTARLIAQEEVNGMQLQGVIDSLAAL